MSEQPFVSVIMPVRNEADFMSRSLGAVLAQDYPHDRLEVLVADGMSTDATAAIVRAAADRCRDVRITLLDNRDRIAPTGLNLAIRRARGNVIVRVDGHCCIAPDYVSHCVAHLDQPGVVGVGGPIRTIAGTPAGRAIAAAMSSKFGVGPSFRTRTSETRFVDTIAFPAYTRAAIDRAGPYDEQLVRNQDDEYNYRLRALGGRLLLAADVRSDYYSRGSLRSLFSQYWQYGYYKVRVMRKHPRQMHPRQFVPPAFVLGLLAAPLAAAASDVARGAVLAAFGVYGLAVLVVAGRIARRDGWRQLPALIAVFPVLHVAYGAGFLAALAGPLVTRRCD
jgi:succinoglycan biosynthesis protein ExoA